MYREYKLKSIPHGNCRVNIITEKGKIQRIELQSYLTTVTVIDLDERIPVIYNTYEWKLFYNHRKEEKKPPQTTIKQIGKFTAEFLGENIYKELKKSDIYFLNIAEVKTITAVAENYIEGR